MLVLHHYFHTAELNFVQTTHCGHGLSLRPVCPAGFERQQEPPNPAVPRRDGHHDPSAVRCNDGRNAQIPSRP